MIKSVSQDTMAPKKRRGPLPTGIGKSINVRLQPAQLAALDKWITARGEPITRPEAVRRLLSDALSAKD